MIPPFTSGCISRRLKEIAYGQWEGKTPEEVNRRFHDEYVSWLVAPIPWSYVGLVWGYCLVWIFIEDWFKLHIYHHLALTRKEHKEFLDRVKGHLHPHGHIYQ